MRDLREMSLDEAHDAHDVLDAYDFAESEAHRIAREVRERK